MFELTVEQQQAVAKDVGEAPCVIDPATGAKYVLIPADGYYHARGLRRLLALAFGCGYLTCVALALSAATETPPAITFPITLAGAAAIMGVLMAFGLKALKYPRGEVRFKLSTAFLGSIPLCIYLAALRWILDNPHFQPPDPLAWIGIAISACFWMVVSTLVLLWFADALVWLAVAWRRDLFSALIDHEIGSHSKSSP